MTFPKLSEREKSFPHPPPRVIFGLFIAIALLQFPVGFMMRGFSPTIGILVNELGVFLALPLLGIWLAGYTPRHLLPFGRSTPQYLLASIVLILGTSITLSYIRYVSEMVSPTNDIMRMAAEQQLMATSSFDFFAKLLILCILVPICEEIFFRGIIQRTFSRYVGKQYAVLITAVFFAFMHSSSWHPHLYFLLGLTLSWISARTRTLSTPILCHMVNNTFALLTAIYGIRFPIKVPFGMMDIITLEAALGMILLGVWLLNRSKRHG